MTLAPDVARPDPALPPKHPFGRARSALRRDLDAPSTWPVLDSLRGATVMAVIVWHIFRLTAHHSAGQPVPILWWPLGVTRLGVDVFFVLSGFLVVRSWHSARRRASSVWRALGDYARRRAVRILPAYWFSLAVLIALIGRKVLANPRHVLLFVTVNQYFRFVLPPQVNVVYWSLTVEWHFYLLVPLIAFLMTRIGRWPVLAGCITLSFYWWSHPKPPWHLPQGFVFGHLDQFVAGAIVGELVVAYASNAPSAIVRIARRNWFGVVVVLGLLAVGSYHGSTLGASRGNGFDPLLHPLFGLLSAAGILHLLTRAHVARLEHRALRAIGMISFSLYLWHYPILHQGIAWANSVAPLPSFVWLPIAVVASLAVTFLVATLSYLLVERPFVVHKRSSKAAAATI